MKSIFQKCRHGFHRKKGRNNSGRITCRHKGGGHPRVYRKIHFQKMKVNIPGKIKTIEYDPNRTGKIVGMIYKDGSKHYQLCPIGATIESDLIASPQAPLIPGNSLPLKNIPLGTNVYNIESEPGRGGKFARAGGTTALLMSKIDYTVTLRLPSNEVRLFSENCWATIGQVQRREEKKISKAGRSRWLGRRPTVRGSAQNAVDHPHGGGEGRAPIGRSCPVTPWGKPALGQSTRGSKKYSDPLILRRRNSRLNI
uniref:Large ribosomal subunit protein uL2m n=1 Tax=Caulerpa lentillifera TaxID=148947 RepID=A0A345HGV6_9CHLO|nr:50S ribosomal protein L2 [Caulerpa lentillifera]AXG75846.1 50S ribosomal protein L2 [Caulerpa lentillifera]QKS32281.1 50S ribosomal protein L2 [Caulerpa lentillifera]QUV75672.1 ribosomal protein L2 [Caulerpa lentillifera]